MTNLTKSEYRRLIIGVQLIRDPSKNHKNYENESHFVPQLITNILECYFFIFSVILLLDEPTWDLDPLNTYLVISILSNAAKKYGTAIILTMEKPRSGV